MRSLIDSIHLEQMGNEIITVEILENSQEIVENSTKIEEKRGRKLKEPTELQLKQIKKLASKGVRHAIGFYGKLGIGKEVWTRWLKLFPEIQSILDDAEAEWLAEREKQSEQILSNPSSEEFPRHLRFELNRLDKRYQPQQVDLAITVRQFEETSEEELLKVIEHDPD